MQDYKPGQVIEAEGPHGPLIINQPNAKPGQELTFRLAAPPDMKITIPKDYEQGTILMFDRLDGARICVTVPSGFGPGDTFEVAPPVLMVKVPEGAQPGDSVVFLDTNSEWLRTRVPNNVDSVGYFAARLPAGSGTHQGYKTTVPKDSESMTSAAWGYIQREFLN